jgi:4,5:9,10-diseco-3-hydroxy-5,9,17-trioxoandrosta-1(10),2-diene-4-oate hydrolase
MDSAVKKDVTIDGVRLAYEDGGEGPPLLCLHAIGHDASDWAGLRERLAARHRVIALDWPGQGRSGADVQPLGVERYAQLVGGLLDALGIDRAVLVGNSVGGAAAIAFASAHPERVRGLVLADPGGLDSGGRVAEIFCGAKARMFEAGARGAFWFPRAFELYYRTVLSGPRAAEQRRKIVARAAETAPLLAEAWRSFQVNAWDVRDRAAQLAVPVLFAWSLGDWINVLPRCWPSARRVPRHKLVTFVGGHSPQLEAPEKFADAVAEFAAAL